MRPLTGYFCLLMNIMEITLTPAQRREAGKLLPAFSSGQVFVLGGAPGMGKTTILRTLQAAIGGVFIDTREFLAQLAMRHPLSIEEAFIEAMRRALSSADTVIVDDLQLVTNVADGCGA